MGEQIISGAQNQECLGAVFPGPQGPWGVKNFNCCGPTTAPEFAEPTLPMQIAFPLQGGRWHGEAVTDEGSCPDYAGGPFPTGRRGRRPLQAGTPDAPAGTGQEGATGAPGSSRPTNGAAFYRGIPAFQSHRSGPVCPPRLYRDTDHQGAHIGAPLRAFRQISAKTGAAPCGRPRADLGSAPTEKRKISAFRVGAGALTRPRRGVTGFDTPSPRK